MSESISNQNQKYQESPLLNNNMYQESQLLNNTKESTLLNKQSTTETILALEDYLNTHSITMPALGCDLMLHMDQLTSNILNETELPHFGCTTVGDVLGVQGVQPTDLTNQQPCGDAGSSDGPANDWEVGIATRSAPAAMSVFVEGCYPYPVVVDTNGVPCLAGIPLGCNDIGQRFILDTTHHTDEPVYIPENAMAGVIVWSQIPGGDGWVRVLVPVDYHNIMQQALTDHLTEIALTTVHQLVNEMKYIVPTMMNPFGWCYNALSDFVSAVVRATSRSAAEQVVTGFSEVLTNKFVKPIQELWPDLDANKQHQVVAALTYGVIMAVQVPDSVAFMASLSGVAYIVRKYTEDWRKVSVVSGILTIMWASIHRKGVRPPKQPQDTLEPCAGPDDSIEAAMESVAETTGYASVLDEYLLPYGGRTQVLASVKSVGKEILSATIKAGTIATAVLAITRFAKLFNEIGSAWLMRGAHMEMLMLTGECADMVNTIDAGPITCRMTDEAKALAERVNKYPISVRPQALSANFARLTGSIDKANMVVEGSVIGVEPMAVYLSGDSNTGKSSLSNLLAGSIYEGMMADQDHTPYEASLCWSANLGAKFHDGYFGQRVMVLDDSLIGKDLNEEAVQDLLTFISNRRPVLRAAHLDLKGRNRLKLVGAVLVSNSSTIAGFAQINPPTQQALKNRVTIHVHCKRNGQPSDTNYTHVDFYVLAKQDHLAGLVDRHVLHRAEKKSAQELFLYIEECSAAHSRGAAAVGARINEKGMKVLAEGGKVSDMFALEPERTAQPMLAAADPLPDPDRAPDDEDVNAHGTMESGEEPEPLASYAPQDVPETVLATTLVSQLDAGSSVVSPTRLAKGLAKYMAAGRAKAAQHTAFYRVGPKIEEFKALMSRVYVDYAQAAYVACLAYPGVVKEHMASHMGRWALACKVAMGVVAAGCAALLIHRMTNPESSEAVSIPYMVDGEERQLSVNSSMISGCSTNVARAARRLYVLSTAKRPLVVSPTSEVVDGINPDVLKKMRRRQVIVTLRHGNTSDRAVGTLIGGANRGSSRMVVPDHAFAGWLQVTGEAILSLEFPWAEELTHGMSYEWVNLRAKLRCARFKEIDLAVFELASLPSIGKLSLCATADCNLPRGCKGTQAYILNAKTREVDPLIVSDIESTPGYTPKAWRYGCPQDPYSLSCGLLYAATGLEVGCSGSMIVTPAGKLLGFQVASVLNTSVVGLAVGASNYVSSELLGHLETIPLADLSGRAYPNLNTEVEKMIMEGGLRVVGSIPRSCPPTATKLVRTPGGVQFPDGVEQVPAILGWSTTSDGHALHPVTTGLRKVVTAQKRTLDKPEGFSDLVPHVAKHIYEAMVAAGVTADQVGAIPDLEANVNGDDLMGPMDLSKSAGSTSKGPSGAKTVHVSVTQEGVTLPYLQASYDNAQHQLGGDLPLSDILNARDMTYLSTPKDELRVPGKTARLFYGAPLLLLLLQRQAFGWFVGGTKKAPTKTRLGVGLSPGSEEWADIAAERSGEAYLADGSDYDINILPWMLESAFDIMLAVLVMFGFNEKSLRYKMLHKHRSPVQLVAFGTVITRVNGMVLSGRYGTSQIDGLANLLAHAYALQKTKGLTSHEAVSQLIALCPILYGDDLLMNNPVCPDQEVTYNGHLRRVGFIPTTSKKEEGFEKVPLEEAELISRKFGRCEETSLVLAPIKPSSMYKVMCYYRSGTPGGFPGHVRSVGPALQHEAAYHTEAVYSTIMEIVRQQAKDTGSQWDTINLTHLEMRRKMVGMRQVLLLSDVIMDDIKFVINVPGLIPLAPPAKESSGVLQTSESVEASVGAVPTMMTAIGTVLAEGVVDYARNMVEDRAQSRGGGSQPMLINPIDHMVNASYGITNTDGPLDAICLGTQITNRLSDPDRSQTDIALIGSKFVGLGRVQWFGDAQTNATLLTMPLTPGAVFAIQVSGTATVTPACYMSKCFDYYHADAVEVKFVVVTSGTTTGRCAVYVDTDAGTVYSKDMVPLVPSYTSVDITTTKEFTITYPWTVPQHWLPTHLVAWDAIADETNVRDVMGVARLVVENPLAQATVGQPYAQVYVFMRWHGLQFSSPRQYPLHTVVATMESVTSSDTPTQNMHGGDNVTAFVNPIPHTGDYMPAFKDLANSEAISRFVLLDVVKWHSPGSLYTIRCPDTFLSSTLLQTALAHTRFFKCDVEIKVEIVGISTAAGALVVSHVPVGKIYGDALDELMDDFTARTTWEHKMILLGGERVHTFVVPFIGLTGAYELATRQNTVYLNNSNRDLVGSIVHIQAETAVYNTSGGASEVSVFVYGRPTNIKVCVPTYVPFVTPTSERFVVIPTSETTQTIGVDVEQPVDPIPSAIKAPNSSKDLDWTFGEEITNLMVLTRRPQVLAIPAPPSITLPTTSLAFMVCTRIKMFMYPSYNTSYINRNYGGVIRMMEDMFAFSRGSVVASFVNDTWPVMRGAVQRFITGNRGTLHYSLTNRKGADHYNPPECSLLVAQDSMWLDETGELDVSTRGDINHALTTIASFRIPHCFPQPYIFMPNSHLPTSQTDQRKVSHQPLLVINRREPMAIGNAGSSYVNLDRQTILRSYADDAQFFGLRPVKMYLIASDFNVDLRGTYH